MGQNCGVFDCSAECETAKGDFLYPRSGMGFGSFHTHEKLVRELCARTNALIVFPEYSRSPEAKYPTAIEQCYYVLSHLWEISGGLCPIESCNMLTIAGDSVGGNMAIAMVLMAMQRGGPSVWKLLLYYPVTNACRTAMDASTAWLTR